MLKTHNTYKGKKDSIIRVSNNKRLKPKEGSEMENMNYLVSGIVLEGLEVEGKKVDNLELVNTLNKGEYEFSIFDTVDNTYSRSQLNSFDLEEVESGLGIENVYVMGKFNNTHKEMLRIDSSIIESIVPELEVM